MHHWSRNLPDIDDEFITKYIYPLEALYDERKKVSVHIISYEVVLHKMIEKRWSDNEVKDCFDALRIHKQILTSHDV